MATTPDPSTTAISKLAAATKVSEPPDVDYTINPVIWNYKGTRPHTKFNFQGQVTAVRVDLNAQQASTIEIDLEDDDFQVLSDPLFANWSFNIEDVSTDSQRKFTTSSLSNSTDTAYLGDEADLEWVLGQRPIDFEIGDVFYRLCGIQSQQTTVTLTFEDRAASKLRVPSGAKSWNRKTHTRAQFVAMLCKEAGVEYFIPELNIVQSVEVDNNTTTGASSVNDETKSTGKNISPGATLMCRGVPMTASQKHVAQQLLGVAHQLNAPYTATVALIYAAMGENSFDTSASHNGVFSTTGEPNAYDHGADYLAQAKGFLTGGLSFAASAISLSKQGIAAWQIANMVELNKAWLDDHQDSYAQHVPPTKISDAIAVVAAYGGPNVVDSTTSDSTATGSYAFTRGPNEDSYDCIMRLASEVAWYAFVRQNKLWYVSGNYLFAQDTQLTCEINVDGVRWIDVDLDMGARDQTAECDIYASTDLWAALPGMMVGIKNRGPASGKWMVNEVQSTPLDETQPAQITVYKPIPKRSEPAEDDTTTGGKPAADLSKGQGTVTAVYQLAKALSARNYIYNDLGENGQPGPNPPGRNLYSEARWPAPGSRWMDCSGSTCEVLWLAGFTLPGGISYPAGEGVGPPVSGAFDSATDGRVTGPGKQMTIHSTTGHVFIEFNIPGIGHWQWNTSHDGGGPGASLVPWGGPGAVDAQSFAQTHYPGT